MKKKVDYKSIKRKTRSVAKAIPLALAITLFSSMNVAASEVGDTIQVDLDGLPVLIDVERMNNDEAYRSRVYGTLKTAFEDGKEILYFDSDDEKWLNFGENAKEGVTLDQMLADPEQYIGDHNPGALPY